MATNDYELTTPWEGFVSESARWHGVGVVVLGGSSGRIEKDRARLLARHGALAISIRWFGGPGQSPGICEIPLETFVKVIDLLMERGSEHIGLVGLSKGAEAALLVACRDRRVDVVVALSPSSVAWANLGPGLDGNARPQRSSWTWAGEPVPFVPYDESWLEPPGPVSYRTLYEQSLRTFSQEAEGAAIPVEDAGADVVLIAGDDDALWPSDVFAESLAGRRRKAGKPVAIVTHPDAGHRPVFPGEEPMPASERIVHGGTLSADMELGTAVWPHVLRALQLDASSG